MMKTFRSPPPSVAILALLDALPFRLRGLASLRRIISKSIGRGSYCFPWKMDNGLMVAISNREAVSQYGVGATCFSKKVWEMPVERTIEWLLREEDVALDIGANIGYFSVLMSRKVGLHGKVIAFEPTPDTVHQLTLTKTANKCENLAIFKCGLGSRKTTAIIQHDPSLSGNASLYGRKSGPGTRQTEIIIESLDGLYAEGKLARCQFVKMDVEGHEMEVLKGGREYLSASKPCLLYEFNAETASLAGYGIQDLVSAIDGIIPDCQHFLIWGEGHRVGLDISTLDIPAGCHIDLIAIPKKGN